MYFLLENKPILRNVDFWGRKCVKTGLFYCAYHAVTEYITWPH